MVYIAMAGVLVYCYYGEAKLSPKPSSQYTILLIASCALLRHLSQLFIVGDT